MTTEQGHIRDQPCALGHRYARDAEIRFASVGCGDIVEKSFLPSLRAVPGVRLLGATRRDTAKLAAFCRTHGIERAYRDTDELLADPDVDVVYVATPAALHVQSIVAAAAHAKHILCEKPLAVNRGEALRAQGACAEHNVRLSVAYYRRRFPEVEKIRSLADEGRLGRILAIRFHHGTWYAPAPGADEAWRIDPALGGGGVLMDIGSHRLDLVHFLCGNVQRVCCRLSRQGRRDWQVEAGATVLLDLEEGGLGDVSVYWNQKPTTDLLWVFGSEATVHVPELGAGRLVVQMADRTESCDLEATPKSRTHVPVIASVVDELRKGTPNPFAIEHVLPTEEILDAAYRSGREGRWLSLPKQVGTPPSSGGGPG